MRKTWCPALAALLLFHEAAHAQAGSSWCIAPADLTECRHAWVAEISAIAPLAQSSGDATGAGAVQPAIEWSMGHVVRVGSHTGIGAILRVGSGGTQPVTGLGVRLRRDVGDGRRVLLDAGWASSDLGGRVRPGADGVALDAVGAGWIPFALRLRGVVYRVPDRSEPAGSTAPGLRAGTHWVVAGGASLVGRNAAIASALVAAFVAVVVVVTHPA